MIKNFLLFVLYFSLWLHLHGVEAFFTEPEHYCWMMCQVETDVANFNNRVKALWTQKLSFRSNFDQSFQFFVREKQLVCLQIFNLLINHSQKCFDVVKIEFRRFKRKNKFFEGEKKKTWNVKQRNTGTCNILREF